MLVRERTAVQTFLCQVIVSTLDILVRLGTMPDVDASDEMGLHQYASFAAGRESVLSRECAHPTADFAAETFSGDVVR